MAGKSYLQQILGVLIILDKSIRQLTGRGLDTTQPSNALPCALMRRR